ncbi:retrovirus-related pol polyprotein from transposon TNT 1-94 [Tanacetum coccineum]
MAQENLMSLGESTSGYGYSYENDPKASCEITWGDSKDEDQLEKDATCLMEIESQEFIQKATEREKEFYTLRMKFDQSPACWSINSASAAVWILGVKHANNRTRNEVSTTRVLELLYLDLFGLSLTQNYRGNFYTLIIVDDHSNYTWVVFIKSNDDALGKFKILSK